jgi:hypothetical protein
MSSAAGESRIKIHSADPDHIAGKHVDDVLQLQVAKTNLDKYENAYWTFTSASGRPVIPVLVFKATVCYAAPFEDKSGAKKNPPYQLNIKFGSLDDPTTIAFIKWHSNLHTVACEFLKTAPAGEEQDQKVERRRHLKEVKDAFATNEDGSVLLPILSKYTSDSIASKLRKSLAKKKLTKDTVEAKLGIFVGLYPWGDGTEVYLRKPSGKVAKYATESPEDAEELLKRLFVKGSSTTATITLACSRITSTSMGVSGPLQIMNIILDKEPEQFSMSVVDRTALNSIIGDREEEVLQMPKKAKKASAEEDQPTKKKTIVEDDDEEEKPRRKKPVADDDDEPRRKKPVADDDDDEPRRKKPVADDDEDTPRARRHPPVDEDSQRRSDRSSARKPKKTVETDEDEEEPTPKRREKASAKVRRSSDTE